MKDRYSYTNELGYHKLLIVRESVKDCNKYFCALWCVDNGDFCGSAEMTKKELTDYLAHFGLVADL